MPVNVPEGSSHQRASETPITQSIHFRLLVLCAILPALLAFAILYRQALPVPYQDDYDAILAFALAYQPLPTAQAKILEIAAAQHNEYKLAFEHAIVATELELTHHVNFAFLTALGDLFLLPIAYLLWRTYRLNERDPARQVLAFLPISFLFFALTYWENLNWAMTGLQNTPVVLFSLLAIYLVASPNPTPPTRVRLLLGCLVAALAALTSANGFLLGPIGVWIFLRRRQYTGALAWCASFLLPLAAYLYHFSSIAYPVYPSAAVTRPLFFFAFLGSVAGARWPAALLGLLVLLTTALALRSRFDRVNPVAVYFTLWVLGTACLVAWVRGAAGFIIASRYSMYSSLMLIFCYAFLAHLLAARRAALDPRSFYWSATVLAVCFFLGANLHAWHKLAARRHMVLAGIEFYRDQPSLHSPMVDARLEIAAPQEKSFEQRILTRAIEQRIYTLPPRP
jgi:hypothetical protein